MLLREQANPQNSHSNGFSLVCFLTWIARWEGLSQTYSQNSQGSIRLWFFLPICNDLCSLIIRNGFRPLPYPNYGWVRHVYANGVFVWIVSDRYRSWIVFYPPYGFQESAVSTNLSGKMNESKPNKEIGWSAKNETKNKLKKIVTNFALKLKKTNKIVNIELVYFLQELWDFLICFCKSSLRL